MNTYTNIVIRLFYNNVFNKIEISMNTIKIRKVLG